MLKPKYEREIEEILAKAEEKPAPISSWICFVAFVLFLVALLALCSWVAFHNCC